MANHDIHISTQSPTGGKKYIEVDFQTIEITPGDTVTFSNNLTPKADASIQFFDSAAHKNASPPVPVKGFCGGHSTSFPVPERKGSTPGSADCAVSEDMHSDIYFYSVSAGTGYHELDPVIIIDKPDLFPLMIVVLAALGGAAVGIVGTKLVSKKQTG